MKVDYYTKNNTPTGDGYEVIRKLKHKFRGNKLKLAWITEIQLNPKGWDFGKIIRLHINGETLSSVRGKIKKKRR